MSGDRVLVLTVGTGTEQQLEETLLSPLRKSIERGKWSRVLLVPSKQTEASAFTLKQTNPQYPIQVRALRQSGAEEDVDACFEHFERCLAALRDEGFEPGGITADFTRGTKAMSAGLALAAVAHGVPTLRYITSPRRDSRGMVQPGTEAPTDFATARIAARRELERAMELMRAGQFAAAERACEAASVGAWRKDARWGKWAAQFWGAWDRFDYKAAGRLSAAEGLGKPPSWVREFQPTEANRRLLGLLAKKLPDDLKQQAAPCRALAADLLANARRRLAEGQTEEVLVRVYRALELVGQYRLLERGYDSCDLKPPKSWEAELASQGERLRPNRDGRIQTGREYTARLLEHLGDPLAGRLLHLACTGEIPPSARNRSILIHGFQSRTRGRSRQVETMLSAVTEFYAEEHAGNPELLKAAQFPFLSC